MSALEATKTAFASCIDPTTKKIDTPKFVSACENIAVLYDALFMGVVAGQLKGDILNSSSNLKKAFLANPDKTACLEDLIVHELKVHGRSLVRGTKSSGVVSMLWAKRAVSFIMTYLDYLGSKPDWPATKCAQQTYELVLMKYHGWITSKMISAVMNLAPGREDIFVKLGLPKGEAEKLIGEFVSVLHAVVGEIQRLLDEHDCDFPDKV